MAIGTIAGGDLSNDLVAEPGTFHTLHTAAVRFEDACVRAACVALSQTCSHDTEARHGCMTHSTHPKWPAIWTTGASLARPINGRVEWRRPSDLSDAGRRRGGVVMRRIRAAAGTIAVLALAAIVEPRYHAPRVAPASSRPIDFIANRGQWDRRIDFAAHSGSGSATVEGATLTFGAGLSPAAHVSLTFDGASTAAAPAGESIRTTRYNFYLGGDSNRWRADVPAFAAVVYRDIYPGIDA